jgi:hypothetical protein
MSLVLVAEVWDALRDHLDFSSRSDAADTLVHLLIDNNYEADDIKDAFTDKDVRTALKAYAEEHYQEDEEFEDYDDSDDDEW